MTTPTQPTSRNTNRTRKRPAEPSLTTPAPAATSVPATSADINMDYLHNMPPGVSAGHPAGPPMYSTDPTMSVPTSQADPYRNQAALASTTAQPAMNMYQNGTGADGQLARLPARSSQLIRMPSFGGMGVPGMPQGIPAGMPTGPMNMNIMGPPGMSQAHGYGPSPQEMVNRELYARVEKMKKKRSSIPPFVMKLSSFVNDEKTDHLIRWTEAGNSFQVLDEDEFSKTLIPDLFKHNNYASFVRQLNMYGFHKVVGLADGSLKTSEQRSKPPSEYENPYFKRGQPELLWLIQKPKSKKAARGGKKQTKEELDSDKEDGMSDTGGADGEIGGVYLEGPKDEQHRRPDRNERDRMDIHTLMGQIEAVRKNQAMISQAINRLRQDHQQLYEQSLAFQSLHDRHENSINAILTFLATVYDKSLGGHINGAVNNLFAHQVEQGQGIHRGPNSTVAGNGTNGAIIPTATPSRPGNGVMRAPMNRRRPLLLEGGPSLDGLQGNSTSDDLQHNSSTIKGSSSPLLPPSYQSFPQAANIQELFTPNNNPGSPTNTNSPQQQHSEHLGSPTTPYSPAFSIPESPTTTSAPAPGPRLAPTPPMTLPITSPQMQHVSRSLAKALRTPLGSSAQALQDHNASLAQKSQEISELEQLQAAQVENIDQLMGMMRDYTETTDIDAPPNDVDQYFDFGVSADGYSEEQQVDIDELLRGVATDVKDPAPTKSPSVGSRAREEIEELVEEVAPKRRKLI